MRVRSAADVTSSCPVNKARENAFDSERRLIPRNRAALRERTREFVGVRANARTVTYIRAVRTHVRAAYSTRVSSARTYVYARGIGRKIHVTARRLQSPYGV